MSLRRLVLLFSLFFVSLPGRSVEKLPIEAFASLPQTQSVQLSPDGEHFAALINQGSRSYLITRGISEAEPKIIAKSDSSMASDGFHWANNERLIVGFAFATKNYPVESVDTRLVSIKYDGSGLINLFPYSLYAQQEQIIDLSDNGNDVIVSRSVNTLTSNTLTYEVYKTNINDGKTQKLHFGENDVIEWMSDRQHRIRVGKKYSDGEFEIIYCNLDGTQWKTAWRYSAFSDKAIFPMGFGADPYILYVSAYENDRKAIFTVDLRDSKLPLTIKYFDPNRDIDGHLIYSEQRADVVGISDTDSKGHYIFWDEDFRGLALGIDKALPDRRNFLVGFSRDETRYLLYSVSDTQPGIYYFGDRKTKQLTPIGFTYPALKPEMLAGKKIVRYKARDGREIEGYLTLPKGVDSKALPTVIFPHGGPIYEDGTDFDYWTEFLPIEVMRCCK
ncbi:MAG TPA: hypothetical protein VGK97_05280 [Spongiibacteraceae bacterium]